jgi:2-polyprenyl-3-methyl-5-hydroxy-6-metoxy-1,4-benzoquinol methylase
MEYQDYSNWKGWLTQVPFGELSALQKKKYALQLERLRIPYKKTNALEIGYGNGSFITFLMNNDSKVEGVEIQEPLLNAARANGISVQNSINAVQNGPYDLIVAFDVLEHLTIEQLKDLFQKCRTLLKEKGVMLFRFPNADSFAGLGSQNGDYTHITAIGQTKLQQLVEPFGLKIERFESEIVYPKNILVHAIRSCFRYLLMKGMGIGSAYYFSGNVVALVVIKDKSV